ncbi:GH25 family lysozyme [Enterococcus villorum]|uniref:GH25 family lysozyme n=1 Tax=Enterococcus villorum TaxID=112904 RepID=UPI0009C0C719|nr:GH25 family lysozyme [Enterococcus villorum]
MKKRSVSVYFYCIVGLLFCLFITNHHVSAEITKETITENNQHTLGDSIKKRNLLQKRSLEANNGISAAEANRPAKDFIDVSSHNGVPTVEEYQTMKKYGVRGVVVKLTEGDSYRNPLAPEQIKHAQEAGLKVSVYHYAWFNEGEDTKDEANFLLAYMNELNLPFDTVIVNDSENPKMNLDKVTDNALTFQEVFQQVGYPNVIHYSNASWFTDGKLDTQRLGKENCWVAQWPYNPSDDHLLHTDKAAWQWASDLYFPEFSERVFDISTDYLGRFVNETNPQLLSYGVRNATPYVYLNLATEDFNENKRFIVYVDGKYFMETYQGKNYYSFRESTNDNIQRIRRYFSGKKGQKIEVFEVSGKPGTSSANRKLLESLIVKETLVNK